MCLAWDFQNDFPNDQRGVSTDVCHMHRSCRLNGRWNVCDVKGNINEQIFFNGFEKSVSVLVEVADFREIVIIDQ